MKHKVSFFAILMMALAIPQSVFAYDYQFSRVAPTGQTLYYNINYSGASVTYPNRYCFGGACNYYDSYAKPTGVVRIPDSVTYNGVTYAVTSISDHAFYDCINIDTLIIPQTVTYIGDKAFYCVPCIKFDGDVNGTPWGALARVSYIQDSLIYGDPGKTALIGYVNGITQANIPNSVTRIGSNIFRNCYTLISVNIPNTVTMIGNCAFKGCYNMTSVNIPNSIISIGDSAFYVNGMTSVTIGNSVTSIGKSAFYNSGLTSVTIPNSVTSIGSHAFSYCNLTSVTIPSSVTWIGDSAFFYCNNLSSVYFNATNCTSMGKSVFGGYSNATLIIGDNVTSVPSFAFYGNGLRHVTLGNNVTSIGDSAFYNSNNLTSITIPESVASIGTGSFRACNHLDTINYNATNCTSIGSLEGSIYYGTWPTNMKILNIGENVSSITDLAFAFCTSLTTVNFNAVNCTTMGSSNRYAFYGCTNLRNVAFGNYVTRIPAYAFINCSGLTLLTVPASVTSIGYAAFYNCSGLTSVTLPNSITTIDQWAFGGCSGLTSVTIPTSVTSIGDGVFVDCIGLTSVTLPNSVTKIGRWAFRGCSGLTSITIPNSIDSISLATFAFCSGLTSITIPEGVTSIGKGAFYGCSGLTSVTIPSSATFIGDSAFAGGDHIIQMTCNATVPPTVSDVSAFDDVFRGIPLYVPTASLSSYRVAYGWREFTNFIGASEYTISATSNNPTMGTVTGGGSYADGATATLTAMPNAGYRFVRWQDGNTENPRTVTVTSDATYIAYFEATQGIDDTESMDVHVFVDNNRIVVAGAAQLPITVFDMTGRKVAGVATGTQEPCSFSTQTAGVYMVRVGDLPARKIVIIK